MSTLKFTVITLFPEAVQPYLDTSMLLKAQKQGIVEFNLVNLREYGIGPHRSVDDTPYGGGDGMLLRCEPIFTAIEALKAQDPTLQVILPTPAGQLWCQPLAQQFADFSTSATIPAHFVILCPRYEGYDHRILALVDHQISLGRYILTGGELPALIIIDSIVRLLPGVLGGKASAIIESFSHGDNLEFPQYTKPADFRGLKVPEVLLSGHHAAIAAWRAAHSGSANELSSSPAHPSSVNNPNSTSTHPASSSDSTPSPQPSSRLQS